jgi:hypothetical protein
LRQSRSVVTVVRPWSYSAGTRRIEGCRCSLARRKPDGGAKFFWPGEWTGVAANFVRLRPEAFAPSLERFDQTRHVGTLRLCGVVGGGDGGVLF